MAARGHVAGTARQAGNPDFTLTGVSVGGRRAQLGKALAAEQGAGGGGLPGERAALGRQAEVGRETGTSQGAGVTLVMEMTQGQP